MGAYFWEKPKSQKNVSQILAAGLTLGEAGGMLELFPEVPSTVETPRALRLVLEKPDLEVWHMAQGQDLQQGRAT